MWNMFKVNNKDTKMTPKAKQQPKAELLTNMFKKQVCLYQWDHMIMKMIMAK